MRGEWWIDEYGSALFADGDAGELGHEGYVLHRLADQILSVFGLAADSEQVLVTESEQELAAWFSEERQQELRGEALWAAVVEELEAAGTFTQTSGAREAVATARDQRDARDYAIRHWGWIRVAGNNAQMHHLDSRVLDQLAAGLEEASDNDEVGPDETFYLETMQPPRVYPRVPLADILARNLSAIYRLADRGYGFGGIGRRGPGGLLWVGAIALGAWLLLRRKTS